MVFKRISLKTFFFRGVLLQEINSNPWHIGPSSGRAA